MGHRADGWADDRGRKAAGAGVTAGAMLPQLETKTTAGTSRYLNKQTNKQ